VTSSETTLAVRRELIAAELVGRGRELELVLAAVSAGRDLLLEGPPGTSKSTILRAITAQWGIPFVLVEGNADLTPAKLLGHHNPARVLREDYSPENFVPGPLVTTMEQGGFLYIEEFNRTPEDTLNTLLTAMSEREVTIPRVGRIVASESFRLVASMNPFDNIGTARISTSIYDRMCRLSIGYQSEEEERAIVALRSAVGDPELIADAVAVTRASRSHPLVRAGSSVRGAIDLALIAAELTGMRGEPADHRQRFDRLLDAAILALSGRLQLHETADTTTEHVVRELCETRFLVEHHRALGGEHRIVLPDPAVIHRRDSSARLDEGRRPLSRKPKVLDQAPGLYRPAARGFVLTGGGDRAGGEEVSVPPGGSVTEVTEEAGEHLHLGEILEAAEPDAELLAMVERITRALSLRRRATTDPSGAGRGRLTTVPYRYRSDEIDLDATIDVLTERPVPDDTDILVRDRRHSPRAVALIGDVSGSMRGEKVRITAATIGALCRDLVDDELAVVAFWKDAALVQPMAPGVVADRVLRDLLRIPARGLTNVHFGLTAGLIELQRARATHRTAILLSDAVHNAGPDPRMVAARFGQLHVLLETDGEHDEALARDLATAGKGSLVPVADHRDVPAALNRLLGDR
jgi:MoxR-like ATPase